MDVRSPLFENIACLLIGVMFLNPIVSTAAELSVDAAAGGNTQITAAANGVPIVNIATPNAGGLSHNKFTDYNVGQQGLILNNGTATFNETQLGGMILGNSNLNGRPANLILNEVTGGNQSQLKGYTEVAGQGAHVVVANPHGITCDGCGFINTPRATLTTGTPVIANGRLDHYDVNGGKIAIEGAGLNASNISQFELITRSAKLNAELQAQRLAIIAGRNRVDATTLAATAKADDGSSKPLLAIDSSALGGMYAGAIRLVGTEAGVGVKLSGDMAASADDIDIDVNGKLTVARAASAANLRATAKQIELTERVYAGNNVNLTAEQIDIASSLASGNDLRLNSALINNQGSLEAGVKADGSGNRNALLDLQGGTFNNHGSVTSQGQLNTDLQQLNNQGHKVLAVGAATIKAVTLNNAGGQLVAQQTLSVTARNLDNRAGTVASNQALSLTLAGTLNNSADGLLLSKAGGLTLNLDTLLNQGGSVLAEGGALTVVSSTTDNRSGNLQGASVGLTASSTLINDGGRIAATQGQHTLTAGSVSNKGGSLLAATKLKVTAASLNNQGGSLGAQHIDLDLSGDLNNDAGLVEAGDDLQLHAHGLSNNGGKLRALGSTGHSQFMLGGLFNNDGGLVEIGNSRLTLSSAALSNQNGTVRHLGSESFALSLADAGQAGGRFITNGELNLDVADWTNTSLLQAQKISLKVGTFTQSASGQLLSFDSINASGDSWHNDGRIETGGDLNLTLTGDYSGNGVLQSAGNLNIAAANASAGSNALWKAGGAARFSIGGNLVNRGQLTAAQNLIVRANSLSNYGTLATAVSLNPQLPADTTQQPVSLPTFSLPQGQNGLFHVNTDPSHPYLVETNPAFASLRGFLSSDYLLNIIGYNQDLTQRRLGDGLYEQRLVQQAIVARTGKRFLDGLSSDEAQFRYLMDNAIASKQALNLVPGIALSAAQVAALTHDIVWMQEQQVDGQKVLVPVLYLAQASDRLSPSGALIQGQDVTLISGSSLKNSGTLRASNNLNASANSISNNGLMQANERLSLLATDSIRNTQGGLIAGKNVSAIALTGDIVNERSVTTHESAKQGFERREDFVDNAAGIEARNNLTLSAGRDLINQGSTLKAGGNANLSAGRDLLIASQSETDAASNRDKKGHSSSEQTSQYGSAVDIGGKLTAQAGRDLAVIASSVKAQGDIQLSAAQDLTIASAANQSSSDSYRKGGGKKVTAQSSSVHQQGSVIESGGNLDIDAGHNLIASASQLKAANEAYLYAGEQLALLSAEDSDYSLYDKKKKGSFGAKETRKDESTSVRQIGTRIETGGDLSLISEGDQHYQKASLRSGGDLTLDSGGAITFEAVKDLDQESHEKSKNSWIWTSAKGEGTTDETLRQSELVAKGETIIRAVDGLHIDIKQVDQQSVSQTIDAMVEADPSLAWLKDAEKRGDVDWRRVQELHDSWDYQHSGLGGPAMMVIAIIVTYLTWGAGSSLIGVAANTAAGAAADAVVSSVAVNAATSTINNRGNLGLVVKDITSADSLKNYVVSGVAAGLTTGLFDNLLKTSTNPQTGKITLDLNHLDGLGRFATNQLLQSGTTTALNQVMGRDVDYGDALKSALLNTLNAAAFNAVGDFAKAQNWAPGSPENIALHALVGGLLSKAAGGDFKTGALAAGANEALVAQLDALVKNDQSLLVASSQLVGIAAAVTVSGDAEQGAQIAGDATNYNYLTHKEADDLVAAIVDCRAAADPDACRSTAVKRFKDISDKKTNLALNACRKGGESGCAQQLENVESGIAELDRFIKQSGLSQQERDLLLDFNDSNLHDWQLAHNLWHKEFLKESGVVGGTLVGGGLAIGKVESAAKELDLFWQMAREPFKVGQKINNAGRAATKHPEIFGFGSTQELRQVYRSDAQLNELAEKTVWEILKKGMRTSGASGRYPTGWVTYTLSDGRAASWKASGEFIGFRGEVAK